MPRRITLRLTTESISNAISEVKDFKKDAMDAMNKLCEEFTKEGKQLVYKNVSQLQFTTESTGNLASSVEGFFDETTGKGFITVFADNGEGFNYAQIVEFGSGVVMAEGKAPLPPQAVGGTRKVSGLEDKPLDRLCGNRTRNFLNRRMAR